MKSICIYCGSSPGKETYFQRAAEKVGAYFAQHKIRLVYGGGSHGLMGVVADACMQEGGSVLGVMPEALVEAEQGHRHISELVIVENMHQRKEMMMNESSGFVALPGGSGTMEELFEVFTWHQLGFIDKPCGLLNIGGYYDHLLAFFSNMVGHGFMKQPDYDILLVDDDIHQLVTQMDNYERSHPPRYTPPSQL